MRLSLKELFTLAIALILLTGILIIKEMPRQACLFPLLIAIPTFLLTIIELLFGLIRTRKGENIKDIAKIMDLPIDESVPVSIAIRRGLIFLGWVFGFVISIWFVGFFIAILIFLFLYLYSTTKLKWWVSLAYSVAVIAFVFIVFDRILNTFWHRGILQQLIGF